MLEKGGEEGFGDGSHLLPALMPEIECYKNKLGEVGHGN